MDNLNVDNLIQDLVAADLGTQIAAAGQVVGLVGTLTDQMLKAFEISDKPGFMAERITVLGQVVRQRTEKFHELLPPGELRVQIAVTLLLIGSSRGIDDLRNEVRERRPHEQLAMAHLANAKVPGTETLIIERLRQFPLDEFRDPEPTLYIPLLFLKLSELGVRLPDDLQHKEKILRDNPEFAEYEKFFHAHPRGE